MTDRTRILLFTGKGGVGKTTCAAATALLAAERGLRTLVLSSDPAHSLADALARPLAPEPMELQPNLFAQEIDLYYSMKKYWSNLREMLRTVFRWQGVNNLVAEEMAGLPGMAEASALLWLEQLQREHTYDLIVVDSAPTGETLTLLTLPQVTQWWVTKAFPFQRTAIRAAGFALRKTTGVPLDRAYDELNGLFERLKGIQRVLADPDISSVRLVMNPERMVIDEARRAYSYLQLYGYHVDAVIVNRVLPTQGVGPAFRSYLRAQVGYLEEIESSFQPLPILRVGHGGEEVFGLDALRRVAEQLYAECDPMAVLYRGEPYQLTADGDAYRLDVHLPFVEGEASAQQFGDEVVIQLSNQRRNYALPKFLAYYTLAQSRMDDGWFRLRFEPATH
ncbi:MAG TPA: TRC40/GET3/ArsA family transport-energizing ATPase [Longimicrobiales bacterium]